MPAKNTTLCDPSIAEFASTVAYSHHPMLIDAGVTIEYLEGDELTHNGYPAAATVRIMPEPDRAAGCADARITIDKESWASYTEDERRALISHEMTHIMPILAKPSKDGTCPDKYKRDNLGRPKLKMRKHDYSGGGGFWSNIEIFQENSVDLQNIIAINKQLKEKKLLTQSNFWG
jgi:hypothetical protein